MPRPRSRVRFHPVAGVSEPRLAPRAIPAVDPWTAGEMFVSPHVEERRRGFAILTGSDAGRRSTLTPHLLAWRVDEPDLSLRAQIVNALGDYYEIRGREHRYPPELRGTVTEILRKFERQHVVALLELQRAGHAGAAQARSESLIHLFERIPNASALLVRLAGDRTLPVAMRQAALEVVGLVGFTDARAALEGLKLRLEGRRAGQLMMLFAPADWPEDQELLPALIETLRQLDEND